MNSRSPDALKDAPICASLRRMIKALAFFVESPAAERNRWANPNSPWGS